MNKHIKSLKNNLKVLLCQILGKNVKVFTSKVLQVCIDLGKNVPSDAPNTLNKQLTTSSVQQFCVTFRALTTATSKMGDMSSWVGKC